MKKINQALIGSTSLPPNLISQVKCLELPLTRSLPRGYLIHNHDNRDYLPYLFVIWLVPGGPVNEIRCDFFFLLNSFKESGKMIRINVSLERLNDHPMFYGVLSFVKRIDLLVLKFQFSNLWSRALF